MILEHEEKIESDFQGTVLDIETIGGFCQLPGSLRYRDVRQVILGYIDRERLHIYCARDAKGVERLKEMTPAIIGALKRPFHAFNCDFESGVWFHHIGMELVFDGELQCRKYESKAEAVRSLRISNYDDPFFDNGLMCLKAWTRKDLAKAIAHNRACLLKERDILLKRGCTTPACLKLVRPK